MDSGFHMINETGSGKANSTGTGGDAENALVEERARGALASISGRELSDEEWLRARAKLRAFAVRVVSWARASRTASDEREIDIDKAA